MPNALYYGDNLYVLRDSIASESVDLIYLDPPFNSQASYNVLFRGPSGKGADAQIEAFEDTWHWGEQAERAFSEVLASPHTQAAELLRAMRSFLGENDVMAYLAMMAVRLIELHRVLKPTGSLYLHCDPTASHYLKLLLDAIFGKENFLNEIIWKRTHAHGSSKRYGPLHDIILFYSKTNEIVWTNPRIPHDESYVSKHFKLVDDARPNKPRNKKKGADGGIDGILFFRSDKDKTEKALVSVKGGENVGVGMVRDLIAVVEREKAAIGVLITLALPTRVMDREATAAGLYETPFEKVPKIQIITLAELFQGKRPRIPRIDVGATFRTAAREKPDAQGRLL